ncbi:MAG TPA: S4 domain-containing protein [bacterium]|nr:S4 domain-containing protein [bacterium]
MRLDLYLKLMGFAKTRMAAKRLCDARRVLVADRSVKPSLELAGGEHLTLFFPQKEVRAQVLALPPGKSVAKKDRPLYVLAREEGWRPQEPGGGGPGASLE